MSGWAGWWIADSGFWVGNELAREGRWEVSVGGDWSDFRRTLGEFNFFGEGRGCVWH